MKKASRPLSVLFSSCVLLTTLLSGCGVVAVAGSVAGAAITVGSAAVSVGGAVVSTGVKVTGKAIEKTIDAVGGGSTPAGGDGVVVKGAEGAADAAR
ncbi:hypothetical protein [Sphaerotilus uruguayifluvii]|uniref:Lipoprotein n=1 Tax=Sphaerotilus uruguayifluvii TaxID=2735897 RepID=A0ABX2G1Q9_9BURK|nr:hypothetical protein [Leptothrix sp. C29]NRT55207.1 hypothetical protein [Leptothrix sp. C29]